MSLFLGIDTSNYTTSAAVFDSGSGKMLMQKKLLPVKEGCLGLRQSDAVFHHTTQLHLLLAELFDDIECGDISAVSVSSRPRSVDGSYMPCFTVGESAGEIVSSLLKVPIFRFSHQEGHISAALFGSGRTDLFSERFIAFHVSGGTTEALLVRNSDSGFSVEPEAHTLDLNAGQAIDRVGLMLGLRFPCGAELEKLALMNNEPIKTHPTLKGCDCCLSGLQNLCENAFSRGKSPRYVAAFCIDYILGTITEMTDFLLEKHGVMPLVYAGGVMSDSIIKNSLKEKYNAVFAPPKFSSDNAAGIAYLGYRKYCHVHAEFRKA